MLKQSTDTHDVMLTLPDTLTFEGCTTKDADGVSQETPFVVSLEGITADTVVRALQHSLPITIRGKYAANPTLEWDANSVYKAVRVDIDTIKANASFDAELALVSALLQSGLTQAQLPEQYAAHVEFIEAHPEA